MAIDNNISSFKGQEDVNGMSGIDLLRNNLLNVDYIPLSASMDHIVLEANKIKNLEGFKKRKVKTRVINLRQNPLNSIQGIENFKITEVFILDKNYHGEKLPSDSPFCSSITEQIDKSGINSGGAKKSQYCM